MVDWLIDLCLTSNEHYFWYIPDDNKFNNIYKLFRNEGSDGSTSKSGDLTLPVNVREYRRGDQNEQRNQKRRVHKTKKNNARIEQTQIT